MGREGGSERAGNGGRLETAALCPGELNWMGTCWGSRCWAWDLDRDWDWDWGELIFVGGYLPGELAKSYLPVDRPTQVAHTLHATAHSKVCLMPELALDAPFHATPSVSSPRPLPVKAQELRLCHRGCPPHTAPSPSTPSMPPPLSLQVCPHSPFEVSLVIPLLLDHLVLQCLGCSRGHSTSPTSVADHLTCPVKRKETSRLSHCHGPHSREEGGGVGQASPRQVVVGAMPQRSRAGGNVDTF